MSDRLLAIIHFDWDYSTLSAACRNTAGSCVPSLAQAHYNWDYAALNASCTGKSGEALR